MFANHNHQRNGKLTWITQYNGEQYTRCKTTHKMQRIYRQNFSVPEGSCGEKSRSKGAEDSVPISRTNKYCIKSF